jgi:hypothetical protein
MTWIQELKGRMAKIESEQAELREDLESVQDTMVKDLATRADAAHTVALQARSTANRALLLVARKVRRTKIRRVSKP